mmetsp:Transcript_11625/g.18525  ORF Transcript_11625/g.18525 Transcript_11625/m.18525 type:complete len:674 (+) Transcript_11625:120-2141(+)|eukprot:CAMPEP_0179433288 /NCGR_PEP_ID=MMETSP0799-20121207/17725_1 /TAXON_ID=46947 /ORGANISM="Geminigera cryophila, Strain CCMP2564" /LENGTH=673 /DNA_ID=CAMNT_0021211163 /DNA_START=111 /DNA_END=2132 /DNA_ORIENTATION=+
MRFCKSGYALLLLSGLTIAAAQPYMNKWTPSADQKTYTVVPGTSGVTCLQTTDMFPTKITDVSALFKVEYFMSYKIVTNLKDTKKYVLVQRGCEADPTVTAAIANITGVTAQYTIPLSAVSLGSSTYFPVFQFMGELPAIRLYTTSVMYASNGCMHKQAADNYTLLNPAATGFTLNYEGGKYVSKKHGEEADVAHPALDALNIQAHFNSASGRGVSENKIVLVSDTVEESFYAVGEWSEYIAAFFNQEAKVKGLADLALKRGTVESNGIKKQFGALGIQKKVLIVDGYFEGSEGRNEWYTDGWNIPACKKDGACGSATTRCGSERWCEIVKAAGGIPMNMNLPAHINALPLGNWTDNGYGSDTRESVTHAQLIAFAKDADVILDKAGNAPAAFMAATLVAIADIKAVKDKMVFDTQAILDNNKGSALYGHAQLEPDVMLQDIIKMLDPTYNHKQVFFRNIMTGGINGGPAMGNDVTCADKPGQPGCIPTAAEVLATCVDPSKTNDVLLYVPSGFFVPATTPAPIVLIEKITNNTIHFVTLTVTMPYSKAEFDSAKQNSFKAAVASAAGTIADNVMILSITEGSRRAGSVKVETKILAKDAAGVTALKTTLGSGDNLKSKINAALKANGLSESTGVTDPMTGEGLDSGVSRRGVPQAIVLGAAALVTVFLGQAF